MVIVITGPTAVGKTKLSIELAKRINGEIINADSTQVYEGLDIVTAKVKEKEGIVHHLISFKSILDNYTVYDFQKDARKLISDILKRGKTPILVGGTGLYIKACLFDYQFNEEIKNNYDNLSTLEIYNKLSSLDENHGIHINNRIRLENALSYVENNNKLFSSKEKSNKLLYETKFIGLTCDREVLYERINKRVDEMIIEGLIDEAFSIYKSNVRTKAVLTPIGCKELFPYFDKVSTLNNCVDIIKQKSRRYAKRQYTWFNNQMDINWFKVDFENFHETVEDIYKFISI